MHSSQVTRPELLRLKYFFPNDFTCWHFHYSRSFQKEDAFRICKATDNAMNDLGELDYGNYELEEQYLDSKKLRGFRNYIKAWKHHLEMKTSREPLEAT